MWKMKILYKQITIRNRFLLWLTWGRRETYPKRVEAALIVWLRWFFEFPWLLEGYKYEAKRNHGSRQKRKILPRYF